MPFNLLRFIILKALILGIRGIEEAFTTIRGTFLELLKSQLDSLSAFLAIKVSLALFSFSV